MKTYKVEYRKNSNVRIVKFDACVPNCLCLTQHNLTYPSCVYQIILPK